MTKSQTFLEAHRLTRAVIVPGISYRATFAIALRELNKAGAKKSMNSSSAYGIRGEYVWDDLKDGRICFFEGKIVVDDLGEINVKLRTTKTELNAGASISLDDDTLTVTGNCRIALESTIKGKRYQREVALEHQLALEAQVAHLKPIVGVSDKQTKYAEDLRRERYERLRVVLKDHAGSPQHAHRLTLNETEAHLIEEALVVIDTNTDAKFWIEWSHSSVAVFNYLKLNVA